MVDFKFERFRAGDFFRFFFDLCWLEFKIFDFFYLEKGNFNTNFLAEKLRVDKSSVQRAVKNLYMKGLLLRDKVNLSNGGYEYVYFFKEKKFLKKEIEKIFENFSKKFHKEIKNF